MFIPQILSEDILKKTCEDSQLCVIAVLPHILDTGEWRRLATAMTCKIAHILNH